MARASPDEDDIQKLFTATKKAYGKVDILVNNTGVYSFSSLENVSAEDYKRQYDTNVLGLLLTTKAALPLIPQEGGSVVNISSIVSRLAPAESVRLLVDQGCGGYDHEIARKELGPRNIRVNAINPGLVITEGTHSAGIAGSDFEKRCGRRDSSWQGRATGRHRSSRCVPCLR